MTAKVPPELRKPLGRPSSYTKAIGEAICARIADGQSLRSICKLEGMPAMITVFQWRAKYPEFAAYYAGAREDQADALAEQMLDVANSEPVVDGLGKIDSGMVQHNRLLVDVLKWRAGKLRPKLYGEKQMLEHTGEGGGPIQVVTGVPEE